MAILILRATSAKLSIGTGEFEQKPPLLAFGAKLEGRESLKLTTSEETKHVDLVVSVKYDENTQKDDKKLVLHTIFRQVRMNLMEHLLQ